MTLWRRFHTLLMPLARKNAAVSSLIRIGLQLLKRLHSGRRIRK